MKREFPVLYEKGSVWIAIPLLGLATMFYAQRAIIGPALEIYSTGMAAFGVTAGLSAVCFQMATTSAGSSSPSVYAGEKFLHSSLLLLQTLLVVYVREAVLVSQFATAHPSLSWQVRGLAAAVLSLLAAAVAWTWYHGFSELNRRCGRIGNAASAISTWQARRARWRSSRRVTCLTRRWSRPPQNRVVRAKCLPAPAQRPVELL